MADGFDRACSLWVNEVRAGVVCVCSGAAGLRRTLWDTCGGISNVWEGVVYRGLVVGCVSFIQHNRRRLILCINKHDLQYVGGSLGYVHLQKYCHSIAQLIMHYTANIALM